jgi:hypothetical protein
MIIILHVLYTLHTCIQPEHASWRIVCNGISYEDKPVFSCPITYFQTRVFEIILALFYKVMDQKDKNERKVNIIQMNMPTT